MRVSQTVGRLRAVLPPLAIFVVNAWVAWRLFFTEYLDQLRSVEGEFISLAHYIQEHWPGYDWFPMWNEGYPFSRAYQPAVHYAVAALAAVSGRSTAGAYHFLAAFSYSLGGVAFYFLALEISRSRRTALGGALLFSLFSPSLLLLRGVRLDAGGVWYARRLQALVAYGELPNVTGLALGMAALALLHRALARRSDAAAVGAAAAIGSVAATNWPATVALVLALLSYVVALRISEWRGAFFRGIAIVLMACGFAFPFALPSTVFATFHNANAMSGEPTAGAARWICVALMCFSIIAARVLTGRASFGVRWAVVWLTVLLWVVLPEGWFAIRILPQAMRFHLALEIPIALLVAITSQRLMAWRPELQRVFVVALALFCCIQMIHYRRAARRFIQRIDIHQTLEYQEARWFDQNMAGARVLAPGTVQFWMNVFTDTPQMTGCCEQSVLTHENTIAGYITQAGYRSDSESGEFALLWMKAFAVNAVSLGGRESREGYRDNREFPNRYRGLLPLVWQSGDDYIYRVPQRTAGLARVVHAADLVRKPPENGVDAAELRRFDLALDDPSLPPASWRWLDLNTATMQATMDASEVVSVAVDYHPGWSARANGHNVPLKADGLGLIAIEPGCNGPCAIEMHWKPGLEARIAWPVALTTLGAALASLFLRRPSIRR